MSNVNLEISPSNVLSNGKISFKNGNPIISFIIGEQDRLLIGRSVRLTGSFRTKMDESGTVTDIVKANDKLNAASKLGVYGAIDQLVIKSQQTHQVIEHMSQSSLIMPNDLLYKQSVLDNPAQTVSGNSFCVPLPCGLFNGTQDIPLSSEWGLKGLLIEIHLAPDNNFLHADFKQGNAAVAPTIAGLTEAFYELSDVKLVCEAVNPSPEQLKEFPTSGGTFEYNSISSYFTSINSTNAILNFNLGLKRVLGTFINFIPSARVNNLLHDGLATLPLKNATFTPAQVERLSFLRGGSKFPIEYDIVNLGKDGLTYDVADSQVLRNFNNSIVNWAKNERMTTSVANTFEIGNQAVPSAFDNLKNIDGGSGFGVGVAYDVISDQGVDFSSQSWGLQMTCGLISNNPTAAYLFAHSKQVIAYNSTGLSVIV